MVFDGAAEPPDGKPGWFASHFGREALVTHDAADYADPAARLRHARTWMHPLGDGLDAIREAGLALDRLREHL